ncbi:MAG: type II toxin-antitoxin system VapC family toxin [Actinomycetota bacterium]
MLSVLDTSILIADRPAPIDGDLGVSVVSIAELQFGVLVASDDDQRARRLARLSAILGTFDPLPVDSAVASSYGQLAAATLRAGRKASARSLDLMIAATAHAHGARLVTANPNDVRHLGDLVEIVQG